MDASVSVDAQGEVTTSVPGWSVRKRVRSATGQDLVVEEIPASFTVTLTGPSRVRILGAALAANGFASDAARIAAVGEDVVAVVDTSYNSIVAYRASFAGAWSAPRRTLVEPPAALVPFLPTSGTFDTFGAIVAWFRSPLDVDDQGAAYVAVWADPSRLRAHDDAFHDGLVPLGDDADAPVPSADVVVTKIDIQGARLWSLVVGTPREDEPYAIRARGGAVAVVGRSRRFPGVDNTVWDAFVAVASAEGASLGARTISGG
jgi:hypothetical protein